MLTVDNTDGLPEEDLIRLEFRLKCEIPTSYREFLKQHNGGQPTPNYFGLPNGGCIVSDFFGVRSRKENYADLVWNSQVLQDRVPKDLLPFGGVEGGDVLCIGISPDNKGEIYRWQHEDEADVDRGDSVDYSNVSFLEKDFKTFLDNLREFNEK